MSTRARAIFNVAPELHVGNIVREVESSISDYLRTHAVGEDGLQPNFGRLRKMGYRSPETVIQGTSGDTGFSLFTRFAIGEDGNSTHRTLQTCIGYPLSELPEEVRQQANEHTVLLSIGDWGDYRDILTRIALTLSTDDIWMVEDNMDGDIISRIYPDTREEVDCLAIDTYNQRQTSTQELTL